ncbi:LamB/YcsF family protein [compost metagenome]
MITDHHQSMLQVVKMVKEGKVVSQQGTEVALQADTICIHGDGASALEFARQIYHTFQKEGIRFK